MRAALEYEVGSAGIVGRLSLSFRSWTLQASHAPGWLQDGQPGVLGSPGTLQMMDPLCVPEGGRAFLNGYVSFAELPSGASCCGSE